MKLKLLDITLCRTPAFSTQDGLEDKWGELKRMISEASPSFYQVIRYLDVDNLKTADVKTRFSVWKYFSRARFRATPYGSFAAFSLVPVTANGDTPVILASGITGHRFTDWKAKEAYTDNYAALVRSSDWFLSNSTIYTLGQDHRYIRVKNGVFEIASVRGFPELNVLLKLCHEKTAKETIYREMAAAFQLETMAIDNLLVQMLSLQLLLTDRWPNITGPDYFKRLNIENFHPGDTYIISERKRLKGGFDGRQLRHIPQLITFLARCLPDTLNPALENFRNAFLKKFEQRAIPLTLAMDPETGVGYDSLGEQQAGQGLAAILNIAGQAAQKELQIPYTQLHRFLLNKLMKGRTIPLDEFEGNKTAATLPLPNTLSVVFHLFEGHPVIENAGGCTANALLGRFTIASNELEQIGRQIASIEENDNPDILFFDIAYQAEKEADNVNRRKQLYQYELPILTWSCDPSPLNFDDILVAIRGREVILWSKKHRRRMVPRIPSAYNYSRSDLAVFRFLCDLQHQQVRSDLNFKMQYFFPHLSFYPRVTFKDVIVSPAMWLLPTEVSEAAATASTEDGKLILADWLRREGINFLFKAGQADQTLCFNPTTAADMDAFFLYCRQNSHKEIYISEALVSDRDAFHDTGGKKYAAQFVANYGHDHPVYQPLEPASMYTDNEQFGDEILFPGGEWLYFEIYCHPVRADSLLLNQVSIFLKEIKSNIKKWFFIRYDDPKPHIRLRLNITKNADGYIIICRLKSLLEPDCKSGMITDIQIKTYLRETERYGAARIERMETLFFSDSKYVLGLLAGVKNIDQLYAATLFTMQQVAALALSDLDEQVAFAKNIAANFSREYKIDQLSFKKLNKRFEELKSSINLDINSSTWRLPTHFQKAFSIAFNNFKSQEECRKLLAHVLHMHVNRLFNEDQRSHEAVLYHYLVKVLMTRRAQRSMLSACRAVTRGLA